MSEPIGNIQPTPAVGVAPPAYGAEAPRPLSIVIDLSVARDNEKLSISGNFLWAQEGSDATAKLGIGFQSGDQYVNFYPGTAISGPQFGDVFLTNTAQAGKWLKLVALKGDPQQLRIQNPVQVFNDVNVLTMPDVTLVAGQSIDIGTLPAVDIAKGSTIVASTVNVAVGETVIAAADATRKRLRVQNIDATHACIVGQSGVGVNGWYINANFDVLDIETSPEAELTGVSTGGGTVVVRVFEEF